MNDIKQFENKIICGDCLEVLKTIPDETIDMVITSPPYWALRDYGVEGQLGLEPTFQEYINKLCDIFDEVKRVLKKTGTCWVNMGDTYGGSGKGAWGGQNDFSSSTLSGGKGMRDPNRSKESWNFKKAPKSEEGVSKSLCQIPSRFAIEMTNRGWILRNEIIWHKPNCMPSSVKDRFTVDFEKIFFFVKNRKYWFETQYENLGSICSRKRKSAFRQQDENNEDLITTNGRNKRCVWKITTKPFKEAHFATYPEDLIETPIKAGCPEKGIVLDPFMGAGTTGLVAKKLGRNYMGIELNPEYIKIAEERIKSIQDPLPL